MMYKKAKIHIQISRNVHIRNNKLKMTNVYCVEQITRLQGIRC